ncbi:MAG: OsmC family protein [Planctomycetes bacterium]|nr:OsmC family protein [Planctomycetota bacterium]
MVQIDIVYQGHLRTQATHGPSKTIVVTDAPVDNHGRGESFSPTDLVATALGSCMLTIMGIVAERRGLDLSGTRVVVEKHMVTDPVRRIGRLPVTITLNRDFGAEERKLFETAALTCPVHKSLHPDIDKPVRFVYPS